MFHIEISAKKNTLVLSMSRNSRKKRLESRNLLAQIDMLRCACQKSKLPKTPVSIKILPSDWSLFVKIRCVLQTFHASHYLCVAASTSKLRFSVTRESTRMVTHSPVKSGNNVLLVFARFPERRCSCTSHVQHTMRKNCYFVICDGNTYPLNAHVSQIHVNRGIDMVHARTFGCR